MNPETGGRFAFGKNWARFLASLDESRIEEAIRSIAAALGDIKGKRFLDAGSGSGLFSLAARRLGARVHSFDYDAHSVACTAELKRRYFPDDADWIVEQGSVLDKGYLQALGQFEVVYSWGVLHHTGDLWTALGNACESVAPGGLFYTSIYNDQGWPSSVWTAVKKLYNRAPPLRPLLLAGALLDLWGPITVADAVRLRPFHTWRGYGKNRGMTPLIDLVDWVGGFPFEVAKPEQIFDFCAARGFALRKLVTVAGSVGCNEFVFVKA